MVSLSIDGNSCLMSFEHAVVVIANAALLLGGGVVGGAGWKLLEDLSTNTNRLETCKQRRIDQ